MNAEAELKSTSRFFVLLNCCSEGWALRRSGDGVPCLRLVA